MAKIRVTKEFSFEMAHALWNYDGPCRNIHGHSYKLFVTVIGEPVNQPGKPKHGMIIDFSDLKRVVKNSVVSVFDHTVVLNNQMPDERLNQISQLFEKKEMVDYQPTCENLVVDFANRIKQTLPESVSLFSVKLYETATSYAEWFAADNQ